MTDYEDYENNLAFPPTTDRTQSTIELVEKIEKLTKQLDIAKKYLSLIKRNVSIASLAYTYVLNAQTEIKELDK